MKAKNRSKTLLATVIALVTAAAIWTAWPVGQMHAITDTQINTFSWGCTAGQTARINVVNPTSEVMFVGPCNFDADGNLLIEFGPTRIAPGHTMSFDLPVESIVGPRDSFGRIQMRAVVTVQRGGPEPHISVEVINNSDGKTTVFVGNPDE